MSSTVKDHNPVLKDVLGIAKALKVDADSLNLGVVDNLYLSVDVDGEEKLIPFKYHEEKHDYRIHRIPNSISDETILNGQIIQVAVSDAQESNLIN